MSKRYSGCTRLRGYLCRLLPLVLAATMLLTACGEKTSEGDDTTIPTGAQTNPETDLKTEKTPETEPETEPKTEPETEAETEPETEPKTEAETNSSITSYDYMRPVPESKPVDKTYFEDAAFIGDSRLVGLLLYNQLSGVRNYTSTGLNVVTAFSSRVVEQGGQKMTVVDAMKAKPDFKRVYIMFGINEVSWMGSGTFGSNYAKLMDTILEINPQAQIYIQSVMPVTEAKATDGSGFDNARIDAYNQRLRTIAMEKQVYYLDVSGGLCDERGYMPASASAGDGIHMTPNYCRTWLEYLMTHVVAE